MLLTKAGPQAVPAKFVIGAGSLGRVGGLEKGEVGRDGGHIGKGEQFGSCLPDSERK